MFCLETLLLEEMHINYKTVKESISKSNKLIDFIANTFGNSYINFKKQFKAKL